MASEEDGGLGTFAALERDDRFDACLIPEPTGFAVVCAQAGALTFKGTVHGRAAHAAMRLEGRSAIDRYVAVHAALAEHEARINAEVAHPAMRSLALPYPLSVGRVAGGEWSSSVPDRLEFEGRVGVRVGEDPAAARAAFEAAVRGAGGDGPPVEIAWTGGAFASGETDPGHPWVQRVLAAVRAERGTATPPACRGGPTCVCTALGGSRRAWWGRVGSSSPTRSTSGSRSRRLAAVARIVAAVVSGAAVTRSASQLTSVSDANSSRAAAAARSGPLL